MDIASPDNNNPVFIIKARFIVSLEELLPGFMFDIFIKAPVSQIFTHFKQPVQSWLFTNLECLCHGRLILPITLFLHSARHSQHAMHFFVSS
jgi:hypothetical protein